MIHHPMHTDPRDPAGDMPAHPGRPTHRTTVDIQGPGRILAPAAPEVTPPREAATAPVRSRHGDRGRHRAVPRRRTARQSLLAVRAVVRAVVAAARIPRRALTGATTPRSAPGGRHLAVLALGPGMLAVNDLPTVIDNLTGWVVGILAGVATLFLTIGGARYLMAGGDPGEVERAKGALKSAAVGYALAMLAPVFMTVLRQILGV